MRHVTETKCEEYLSDTVFAKIKLPFFILVQFTFGVTRMTKEGTTIMHFSKEKRIKQEIILHHIQPLLSLNFQNLDITRLRNKLTRSYFILIIHPRYKYMLK